MENLSNEELKNVNGGSTCPTYDISDNYDGMRTTGSFIAGFIMGLFNL